jgi:hypothetical protein
MNLGAFFAAPVWKRRKKPGFTLVSFARHPVTGQKDTASIPCAVPYPEQVPSRGNPASFLSVGTLAVCCASRIRPQKIGFQPIFYPTNCVQTEGLPYQRYAQPDNRGFFVASSAKNPQVQQAASRLIILNDLIREEDEKKNMNHQGARRNTKYLISWF